MSKKNTPVDAIVVGAGAGGGVVAKELATHGIEVVLFERGDWTDYDQHINDELINQRGILKRSHGPDISKRPTMRVTQLEPKLEATPIAGYATHIAAVVGSGTVSYGAMAWRFMAEDFTMKSTYGPVEGSSLEDWPISYEDLEPYYEKAEYEVGVSGESGANPFESPRKSPYPMPPFENNEEGTMMAEACKRLGLHPFPIPMARNSVPYNGRAGCIRNRTCVGHACPVDAKNGTQNSVIPVALKSGNCELRTKCEVVEILTDNTGKATGVRYFDEQMQEHIQPAELVVVAACATETARLLLNSRTSKFPDGLGNNNDMVGRNIQSHAYTGAIGFFDHDVHHHRGPGATFAVCDFNHHNEGIIGGGLLANEFYEMPYKFSKNRPPGAAKWGKAHKDFQREYFRRMVRIVGPIQEMPNADARVIRYDKVKDFWGMPVAGFAGGRHSLDRKHCQFLSAKAGDMLREAGATIVQEQVGGHPNISAGVHQMGTCRMGDDPATSVTDKYGKVHDTDNLYVADGSLCVTGGGFNPALTIMALGYWVGEHLTKRYTSD